MLRSSLSLPPPMDRSTPAPASSPASTGLSFDKTDKLQRRPFCQQLERYLMVESNYVEGSLVATLAASFGSGKTTFIEMWKEDLLKRRQAATAETAFTAPMPVVLNAWESDFCGDPLAAILSPLLKTAEEWKHPTEISPQTVEKLKEAIRDIAWTGAGLLNGVTDKFTGINAIEALELKDQKKKERNSTQPNQADPPDFIRIFDQRQNALRQLRTALQEAFAPTPPPEAANPGDLPKTQTPKVLIFVDELDRCRPDYAIHYLETIKHVFNVKGLVFVLAIDAAQLEVSAKALFGGELNFPEYYRKFSHRTFHLPQPDTEAIGTLLKELADRHIVCKGQRQSAFVTGDYFTRMVAPIVHAWKVTPRQLHEAFRILGHSLAIEREHGTMETHNTTISLAYLFASLARTAKERVYRDLQTGVSHLFTYQTFKNELPMSKCDVVTWIYIMNAGINRGILDLSRPDEMTMIECTNDGNIALQLKKTQDKLGHRHSTKAPFQIIYERIESAYQFEDAYATE